MIVGTSLVQYLNYGFRFQMQTEMIVIGIAQMHPIMRTFRPHGDRANDN